MWEKQHKEYPCDLFNYWAFFIGLLFIWATVNVNPLVFFINEHFPLVAGVGDWNGSVDSGSLHWDHLENKCNGIGEGLVNEDNLIKTQRNVLHKQILL